MDGHAIPMQGDLGLLLPAALLARCHHERVPRGERLFETGQRPAWMYIVGAGEVVLQRIGEGGETVVLQRARHGLVGEASLQAERYHCDAVVVADAEVTRVPLKPLLDALRSDGAFALRWIGMLNREVRRLRQQSQRLSLNTVQARLLHLMRTEGGPSGLLLRTNLKNLARELAVSHEALYRCVALLEQRGLLERRAGMLRLREAHDSDAS